MSDDAHDHARDSLHQQLTGVSGALRTRLLRAVDRIMERLDERDVVECC